MIPAASIASQTVGGSADNNDGTFELEYILSYCTSFVLWPMFCVAVASMWSSFLWPVLFLRPSLLWLMFCCHRIYMVFACVVPMADVVCVVFVLVVFIPVAVVLCCHRICVVIASVLSLFLRPMSFLWPTFDAGSAIYTLSDWHELS
jgi:hypothetical protein